MSDKEALWVHVFRAKYQMKDDLPDCIAWDKSSVLWKSLLKIRSLPRENLLWSVGDGNKIRCWKDNWIPSIWPPVRHIRANANLDLNCFLNEMITDKGSDKISRSHISSGAFSVKTTYKVLKEGRLFNNVKRVRRGLATDPSCPLCGYHSKDILHILRDYTVAKEDNSKIHEGGASWACLFGLLIWHLWNNRNLFNFQRRSRSSREIVQVSYSWAIHFFSSSREVPIDCLKHSFEAYTSRERIFLNTDGAVQLDLGYVTVEGVVCGFKLIQRRGQDQFIIQFDNLEVVKAILGSTSTVSNSALIRRIQNILTLENQWFLWYIPREQNQVADCLAKQALIGKDELQEFEDPPMVVRTSYEMDKSKGDLSF
ncbi:hypothetical protein Goshw_029070 [Gossypium schwendimanii]|uniref:RNase H type-1 domain-containing protein n=1 Tax=Gossypium schwendimanii TaxID=34291 RepID=A0A7J9MKS0_GOSSC|nr:hypothetical protein [Gossypium schwendimanii]